MFNSKTRVVRAKSVCAIDYDVLKNEGIDTILFDIEGTITTWGGGDVEPEIIDCIQQSNIPNIGIVTNMNKRYADRARKIAQKIGAGSSQYPKLHSQRKPRAYMIEKAIEEFDTSPEKTVMIGDKLLDVLAAKNAGLPIVFWIDMLPGRDHWFDHWIYRKIEPLLKKIFVQD